MSVRLSNHTSGTAKANRDDDRAEGEQQRVEQNLVGAGRAVDRDEIGKRERPALARKSRAQAHQHYHDQRHADHDSKQRQQSTGEHPDAVRPRAWRVADGAEFSFSFHFTTCSPRSARRT